MSHAFTNNKAVAVKEIKPHPLLDTDIQIQLIKNGLPPVFAMHAHTSSFLSELPALTYDNHFASPFSHFVSINYSYRMHDLCNMLYSACLTINRELVQLDKHAEQAKKGPDLSPEASEEENHYREIIYSRTLDSIRTHDTHLREVKNFAIQGFIIQLWALNEKHLSQILNLFSKESKLQFVIPSKWDGVKKILKDLEIDTGIIPKTFSMFDELRVLSNKIKHLGEVDSKLAEFESFKSAKGMLIDDLELDLQQYLNCSYAFFVFLSEHLSSKILNPTLRLKLLASPRYTEILD